jgi:ATP-dependent RNA helicase SUPV3L1/SUV3
VPDFRNVMSDAHARLLAQIFRHLRSAARRLPEDWVAAQVAALDRVDGDTDALLARIAHIRTWTYVSHRASWLADAVHWQARTRAVEDHLSDALHERLTQQFVDRGASVIARVEPGELVVEVAADGDVHIQGLRAGRLDGFRFVADPSLREDSRLRAAANRVLRTDIGDRVRAFVEEADAAFSLDADGQVSWRGTAVGRLVKGDEPLRPRVEPAPSDLLEPTARERVRRRLAEWVDTRVGTAFAPLLRAETEAPAGAVRGIVFALRSGLGLALRRDVGSQLAHLDPEERRALARLGISLGRLAVFLPALDTRDVVALRGLLWAVHRRAGPVPVLSGPSAAMDPRLPATFNAACGYLPAGRWAVRADRLERLAAALRKAAREGRGLAPSSAAGLIGVAVAEIEAVAASLGFRRQGETGWQAAGAPARGPKGPVRRAG